MIIPVPAEDRPLPGGSPSATAPPPLWLTGDLTAEVAAATAASTDSPSVIFYDSGAVQTSIASATSVDAVVGIFNSTAGAAYGIRLALAAASSGVAGSDWSPVSEADLQDVQGWASGIAQALAHYRPVYLLALPLDTIYFVADITGDLNKAIGFSNGTPDIYFDVHRFTSVADAISVWHHELMHIAQSADYAFWGQNMADNSDVHPAEWLAANPPGFSYLGRPGADPKNQPLAFASNYGMASFAEDLAEIMTELWKPEPTIYDRMTTDVGLKTKVQILLKWLNGRGMSTFNAATGLLGSVTLRLPDPAPDISRFGFRFGDGSADLLGTSSAINTDRRSVTRVMVPGTYSAIAYGVTDDNRNYVYTTTYTVSATPPTAVPVMYGSGEARADAISRRLAFS